MKLKSVEGVRLAFLRRLVVLIDLFQLIALRLLPLVMGGGLRPLGHLRVVIHHRVLLGLVLD